MRVGAPEVGGGFQEDESMSHRSMADVSSLTRRANHHGFVVLGRACCCFFITRKMGLCTVEFFQPWFSSDMWTSSAASTRLLSANPWRYTWRTGFLHSTGKSLLLRYLSYDIFVFCSQLFPCADHLQFILHDCCKLCMICRFVWFM
jgi:hypothetical protein